MSDHHWFAATYLDWQVGTTKEDAVKKLARVSGVPQGGTEALVCQVHLPIKAPYQIVDHLPNGVPREKAKRIRILNKSGKFTE